jgi:hypothetical protein
MSHPDFHNGHYHYLRQLSILNDKAFTPEGFKVTYAKGNDVEDIKTTVKIFKTQL